jgi:hypothetical protein
MPDLFQLSSDSVLSPARSASTVSPSDSNDFLDSGVVPKALYVGGAGNVAVRLVDDAGTVTFVAVPAGAILPVRPRRVLSTGTTASSIVALN